MLILKTDEKWESFCFTKFADFSMNFNKIDKFPKESFSTDAIYCSNIAERIEPYKIVWFFSEIYRILKNKGIFRIVVPDIEIAIRKYKRKEYNWLRNKNNPKKPDCLPNFPLCYISSWIYTPGKGRRVAFNDVLLVHFLKGNGFKNIKKMRFNECSNVFKRKDSYKQENNSLFYEAIKEI